jgi:alkanesulfonate monooxygenase SsuD/methylene tetrahydromethanopterin reductase-like flavin-dependent oxidoreductase (luciferase family)
VKLGTILLWGDDLDGFREELRLAEELGYEVIGVGDSPAAWHEMYVSLTVAALETQRATLTPMVTTPFLRHPSVTVSTMSSLHDLTGGRATLTVGSGGSALRAIGRGRAATQQEMREYVDAVRALSTGRPAVFEGRSLLPLVRARNVPLFVAAFGPKGLSLAGELADGVVMSIGSSLEVVDQRIATVRRAAQDAGRDPDAIEIWGMSFVSVRDSREEANADITAFLASTAGMGLKAAHMRALVPPDLLPAVEEMERRYDATQHVVVGGANAKLLEELGLVDFMVGLTGITGGPAEVGAYAAELEARGISCVLAGLPGHADPHGMLMRFSQAVRN